MSVLYDINNNNKFQYRPLVDCTPACTGGRVPAWRMYLPGGVPAQGVPARGCTCLGGVPAQGYLPGGYLPKGVPTQGVPALGVYLPWWVPAQGGTYPGTLPPVNRMTDRQV